MNVVKIQKKECSSNLDFLRFVPYYLLTNPMKLTLHAASSNSAHRTHDVVIQRGLLNRLPRIILRKWPGRHIFIITDWSVQRIYGRRLLRGFSALDANASLLDVPAGERSKTPKTVYALQTQLLRLGVDRNSVIVALGGGVIGDLAGYVAATILRGIDYLHVPTTLLAQVDSSIGGKVGVDHPLGKNLIGAFYQPATVCIDPDLLKTLPVSEFKNGLAEVVKIAAALDRRLFSQVERNARKITKGNPDIVHDMIVRSVKLKASVVERDPFESGLRKVLNLGHTIGHAVEAASGYDIKHGAAVSIGLATESRIAMEMGLLSGKDYARLIGLLTKLKLPLTLPRRLNKARFMTARSLDKKSEAGGTKFVLLKAIGHTVIGVDVPTPFIEAVFSERLNPQSTIPNPQ